MGWFGGFFQACTRSTVGKLSTRRAKITEEMLEEDRRLHRERIEADKFSSILWRTIGWSVLIILAIGYLFN